MADDEGVPSGFEGAAGVDRVAFPGDDGAGCIQEFEARREPGP
jgi:hypothetical protein